PIPPSPPRSPLFPYPTLFRSPVRRGTTAEQYVEQADEFYKNKQYDDALEAYSKAVELKPIAHAYYQVGWIYDDREDYDQAGPPLDRKRTRLNSSRVDISYAVF